MTFAIAVPHCIWIPERRTSFDRLADALHITFGMDRGARQGDGATIAATFTEKEPNHAWSQKLWAWGAETGCDHLIQIQDDVIPAPNFWPALTAMVKACPDQVIGLQGAHPAFRELARDGHRWAQSKAWLVGVAYVVPRAILTELVEWRSKIPQDFAQSMNEDDLLSHFLLITGRSVYHPIPTIVDHDTDVASSYGNDNHMHRKATVTWKEFGAKEIEDPAFWKVPASVPLVSNPHLQGCWACHTEPSYTTFATGLRLGRKCLALAAAQAIAPFLNFSEPPNELPKEAPKP